MYRRHVLVKKMFTNGLNMCFTLGASVEKRIHGVETLTLR